MLAGTKDCHHGKDRNVKLKERNKKKTRGWMGKETTVLYLMSNYS